MFLRQWGEWPNSPDIKTDKVVAESISKLANAFYKVTTQLRSYQMRCATLAALVYFSLTCVCYSAPFLTGEVAEAAGRTTSWSVYDDSAVDNPVPVPGEFTYIYVVENSGSALLPVWQFGLSVDQTQISSTTINGVDEIPGNISPGLWQWWLNDSTPLTLFPGEKSIEMVVTSTLAPGPSGALIYSCHPALCTIGLTQVVGPAVPEPTSQVLLMTMFAWALCTQRKRCSSAENRVVKPDVRPTH